jgi:hypothetical protein
LQIMLAATAEEDGGFGAAGCGFLVCFRHAADYAGNTGPPVEV